MADNRLAPTHAPIVRLGNERLDDDHDEFVRLVVALKEAEVSNLLETLDNLHAHVESHFAAENELMAQHDFSSKGCHLDNHAAVLQFFADVRAAVVAGRSEVAGRFADHLVGWLPEHVDALDRHLAKFIFYRRTGGAQVLIHR